MVRFSAGCCHAGDPATQAAVAVLLDISGLFLAPPLLSLHHGDGAPESRPSIAIPCWRCAAGTDAELASFVAGWLRKHRDAFSPDGLAGGVPLWTRDGPGLIRLAHDPISLLVAGLQLLELRVPRDLHGRTREEDDPLYSEDLAPSPVANFLAESLLQAADAVLKEASIFGLAAEPWPPGVPWVLGISHDIDHLRKWRPENRPERVRDMRRSLVQRRGILRATRNLLTAKFRGFGRSDPYQNAMEMARQERDRGLRATYFFGIAEPSSSPYEITYTPGELREAVALRELAGMGHEIGLHGSYASAEIEGRLTTEREALGAAAGEGPRGVRQHYLRFSWERVVPFQVRAGFDYDCSWGYARRPGFRGGLATPFRLGPLRDRQAWRVELPMAVMDTSLREFLHLDMDAATRLLDPMVRAVAAAHGLLVVNWHNTAFDRELPRTSAATFDWLVEAARRREARSMTLGEVARWWSLRRQVQVRADAGPIQVTLPAGLPSVGLRVLGAPPTDLPEVASATVDQAGVTCWIVERTGGRTEVPSAPRNR